MIQKNKTKQNKKPTKHVVLTMARQYQETALLFWKQINEEKESSIYPAFLVWIVPQS